MAGKTPVDMPPGQKKPTIIRSPQELVPVPQPPFTRLRRRSRRSSRCGSGAPR
jgi:hypothetical protein